MAPLEVLTLAIRSLVAKETNAPDVLHNSYPESSSFFHNDSSVYFSLHTLQFTSNYYPNVRENIKCIILNTVRRASHFTF